MPVQETKSVYTLADLKNWDAVISNVSPRPRVAVFGDPVEHSLSPQLHNPALEAAGIDAQYIRLQIRPEEFDEAVRLLPELGFYGTNCTIPHKFLALAAMDEVDDLAKKLGAVNTVVCDDDKRLVGFNSDGPGFLRAVREEFMVDVRDLRVMIIGAGGGAGRAVAVQCAVEDCERLVLVNRTAEKAVAVAQEVAAYFDDDRVAGAVKRLTVCPWETDALREELDNTDLIVNATSIGMKRTDPELLPQHLLQPHHMAFDMIYSPIETKFLKAAKSNGARTTNGLPMLLWQGVFSFEWWFNRDAPVDAMRAGLMAAIKAK
ncbi:MAG: shikimate dehydrogenase [Verrucomicrobiales bacterium]